jgi:glycolate oxidase FAD binding subunit
MLKPASEKELGEIVRSGGSFELLGSGTKRGLGRHVNIDTCLSLSKFSGISLYEPEELVLEAGAATPLADIEKLLAKNSQQLAFEPPDYGKLLGVAGSGTLGGLVSCGLSGPRRPKAGAVRDHILGFSGVSGRGEQFKAGGRVVKNVTGFDISKLMAGAFGTLAALTSITMKVLPAAETEETLVLKGLSDASALQAMGLAMQSSFEVSAAAHLPGDKTLLRLEGFRPSVIYRKEKLAVLLKDFGGSEALEEKQSRKQWKDIRDVGPIAKEQERIIWKLSVTPSRGPEIIAKICQHVDARYFLDWAGGLIWLSVPATPDAATSIIRGNLGDGHATLMRASKDVRSNVDVFQPQGAALHALTARVKASFDPACVFNPGRMYKDT